MTKRRSITSLIVLVVLTAVLFTLALTGAQVYKYRLKPMGSEVSLGFDLGGGAYAVYIADGQDEEGFEAAMLETISIMKSRLAQKGYSEAAITRQGSDGIRVEIPGYEEPGKIFEVVGAPARLEFRDPDGQIVIKGSDISYARAQASTGNYYDVAFMLKDESVEWFAEETQRLLNQTLSIYLDSELMSSPVINSAITGGEGAVSIGSDLEEAENFALLIQTGELPLTVSMAQSDTASASLGIDALRSAIYAAAIGIVLVMLLLISSYRLPGVLAAFTLMVYAYIVVLLLAIVPGTQLTLSGIAGIALGVFMAIDSYIIIFERFRTELEKGRSLESARIGGFKNAQSPVLDYHIIILILAIALVTFSAGPIKSFAMALIISILSSLFTAFGLLRWLMKNAIFLKLGGGKLSNYARGLKA